MTTNKIAGILCLVVLGVFATIHFIGVSLCGDSSPATQPSVVEVEKVKADLATAKRGDYLIFRDETIAVVRVHEKGRFVLRGLEVTDPKSGDNTIELLAPKVRVVVKKGFDQGGLAEALVDQMAGISTPTTQPTTAPAQ